MISHFVFIIISYMLFYYIVFIYHVYRHTYAIFYYDYRILLYVYRFVFCNASNFSELCNSLEGPTVDEQCSVG